jgi:hypothetical protein
MKQLYSSLVVVLLYVNLCIAQTGGKRIKGPIEVAGYQLNTGDTLTLGIGTGPLGSFKYIYSPSNFMLSRPQQFMPSQFNGKRFPIYELLREVDKAKNETIWIVLRPVSTHYDIDFKSAIAAGELVAINGKPIGDAPKQGATLTSSVADELLKLKSLLDAGAITKDEYEQQKKKLLN